MKNGVKRVIKYYNIMLINAYCYRLNYHTFKKVKINMRPCFSCDIYKISILIKYLVFNDIFSFSNFWTWL